MKRIWVMAVGFLLGSNSSVWAEQTSSTSDYLKIKNLNLIVPSLEREQ